MTLTIEIPGMKPVPIELKSEMSAQNEIYRWADIMVKKAMAGDPAEIKLKIEAKK